MRKIFAVTLFVAAFTATAQAGLFGPGDFEVKQIDTRFSENQNPTFTGQNNRISSKSIAGGMHIDSSGVYVDPTVTKDQQTGQVTSLALIVTNLTSEDTQFGDVNSLGTPQLITFLLNGQKVIALQIRSASADASGPVVFNSIGRYASVNVSESGVALLTTQQYAEIVSAESLAVRLQGSKRTVTYESDEISSDFVENLKAFSQKYVH